MDEGYRVCDKDLLDLSINEISLIFAISSLLKEGKILCSGITVLYPDHKAYDTYVKLGYPVDPITNAVTIDGRRTNRTR